MPVPIIISNEHGIKTTRTDASKTGFILANNQDIDTIFLKLSNISYDPSGDIVNNSNCSPYSSISAITNISINTSGNSLKFSFVKDNQLTNHCSYCYNCYSHCTCRSYACECYTCQCTCCSD